MFLEKDNKTPTPRRRPKQKGGFCKKYMNNHHPDGSSY